MEPPPPPADEFVDQNGNGQWDAGEPVLGEWNDDGTPTRADPFGRANGGGWMVHYKWCLGQTKTVKDPRFARRVTYIYPNETTDPAIPARDTWSLRHDVDCNGLDGVFLDHPEWAAEFRALAGMPPLDKPIPEKEQENCVAFSGPAEIPGETDPIVGFKVYQQPGSHHLIAWDIIASCNQTDGANCHASFFPASGVNRWKSFICNEVASIFDRTIMSGSQRIEYPVSFPDDAADAGHGEPGHVHSPLVGFAYGRRHYFLFNHHIQRYDHWDPTKSVAGEAWISYYRAPREPRNEAHVFLEGITGDATILIPPYTVGKPAGVWYPPRWPAWVFNLSAHMHKRGLSFITNKIPANPPAGTGHSDPGCNNAEGLPFLYETDSWSEPRECFYTAGPDNPQAQPIRIDAGEGLQYQCLTNNGVKTTDDLPADARQAIRPYFQARDVKWACEEVPGVPPNVPFLFLGGRYVVPCTPDYPAAWPLGSPQADADCCRPGTGPGTAVACVGKQGQLNPRVTGRCVPANLVFGPSQDDEMCLLPGMYWMDENGIPSGFPQNGFGGS
jgi:hypothetical protein